MTELDKISNSENFSLKEFFKNKNAPLDERLDQLNHFLSDKEGSADILYRRKVMSTMDREVLVEDPFTNKTISMLMFGSNSYLGLSSHPKIKSAIIQSLESFGSGLGGPPLLNGYTELHYQLERKIADWKKTEASLLTATGYMANLTWINALIGHNDIVFVDEHNHSSIFFGLSTAKCRKIPFKHNDLKDLKAKVEHYKNDGDRYLIVEGVYSMDGDLCPLPDLVQLAKEYDLKLIIDDAHGTGIIGKNGGGTVEHYGVEEGIFLHIGTFSKALASIGGFIAADKKVIDYLRYLGAQYMFSASAPPHVISGVIAGLDIIMKEPERRIKLHRNVEYLVNKLTAAGVKTSCESAIIPIILPVRKMAKNIAISLHKNGIFVNCVEFPAVSENEERIRISLCSNHTFDDIDRLLDGLLPELRERKII